MKKSILIIIIFLLSFIISIQIVNDLKTKPYIEFDWMKEDIYTIIITFGSSDISNYKCGLYNETRFCVAKECKNENKELKCSFEGKNCLADSNNKGYKFYYDVICGEGLPNKSGIIGKDVKLNTDFTTIISYNKVSVTVSINSTNFLKYPIIFLFSLFLF